jgi:hypothetical protein
MNPRTLHVLNRLLTPVVDLVFVVTVVTGIFLGIGWFYDVVIPWVVALTH